MSTGSGAAHAWTTVPSRSSPVTSARVNPQSCSAYRVCSPGLAGGPLIAWFTDPAGNVFSVIAED